MSESLSHPLCSVFSKLPSAAIHSSIAMPLSLAFLISVSLKVSIDTPASVNTLVSFSQSEPKASASSEFRALEDSLIRPANASDKKVNNSFASLKSPTISSQVCVHPDCVASFNESINWVKVFTFVAAFWAMVDMLRSSYACSSVTLPVAASSLARSLKPFSISAEEAASSCIAAICCWLMPVSLARYSSAPDTVIFLRVVVNTSDVIQPSLRDSLNVPAFSIIESTAIPYSRAVCFKAFWNISPPRPALFTEFQSWSLSDPAANAWESWYIAVDACWAFEPDTAARLAIPWIASVASWSPTPAAVNVPMLRVISVKL